MASVFRYGVIREKKSRSEEKAEQILRFAQDDRGLLGPLSATSSPHTRSHRAAGRLRGLSGSAPSTASFGGCSRGGGRTGGSRGPLPDRGPGGRAPGPGP